jgi:hypothetical protein
MAILIDDGRPEVYFGVKVSKARAEYLFKCLLRPLCTCGREVDECEADPCNDRRIADGELAYCSGCKDLFDPQALDPQFRCAECRPVTRAETRYQFECRECGASFPEGEGWNDWLCLDCGEPED